MNRFERCSSLKDMVNRCLPRWRYGFVALLGLTAFLVTGCSDDGSVATGHGSAGEEQGPGGTSAGGTGGGKGTGGNEGMLGGLGWDDDAVRRYRGRRQRGGCRQPMRTTLPMRAIPMRPPPITTIGSWSARPTRALSRSLPTTDDRMAIRLHGPGCGSERPLDAAQWRHRLPVRQGRPAAHQGQEGGLELSRAQRQ